MRPENEFPAGWDEARVRELLDHYGSQTDEEAAAEHEAALSASDGTVMQVPRALVPVFRQLIAEHAEKRSA